MKRREIPRSDSAKNYTKFLQRFQVQYPKFRAHLHSREFKRISEYLFENREKMIWAIEDLDRPPLEGIGKNLVKLNGVDFKNPDLRRMTGAIIATILSEEYQPHSSGHRVSWRPFITGSRFTKI